MIYYFYLKIETIENLVVNLDFIQIYNEESDEEYFLEVDV